MKKTKQAFQDVIVFHDLFILIFGSDQDCWSGGSFRHVLEHM